MNIINEYGECYFVDLHSFSDEFVFKILNKEINPDICIEFDKDYIESNFLDYTINFFKNCGYDVRVNFPYSGTFIPNIILENNNMKINSIML